MPDGIAMPDAMVIGFAVFVLLLLGAVAGYNIGWSEGWNEADRRERDHE